MKKLNINIIIVSDTRTAGTDKSGKLLKKLIGIAKFRHYFEKLILTVDNL